MAKKKYCACGFSQSTPPHTHSLIEPFKYVLVVVYDGLIERVEPFRELKNARKEAREVWAGCDAETDDVKVLDIEDGETIYWTPPVDGNN
jgi:hypothetical protein